MRFCVMYKYVGDGYKSHFNNFDWTFIEAASDIDAYERFLDRKNLYTDEYIRYTKHNFKILRIGRLFEREGEFKNLYYVDGDKNYEDYLRFFDLERKTAS